jgi:4-hydroxy-4-methyl-2-oxoglutarate aldolase
MKKHLSLFIFLILSLGLPVTGRAQLGLFSKQQLIEFTPDWHGARFANGRPDVPDSLIQRLKDSDVTSEQAWEVLMGAGYRNQFEGEWQVVNASGQRLIGRVVTAVFMPYRPDVDSVIRANGKNEGERVRGENSWIINTLQPGDVMVVNLFGKIKDGTIIGSNLGTSIATKERNGLPIDGLVCDCSIRDTAEIEEIKGFEVYCRGLDPSALRNVMLMGINVPIRIGKATVMPGDIAVGDPEGVTFIPPQLVEQVADHAEQDHLVDDWGEMMLREQKYTPGQIDGRWTNQMIEEFNRWAASKGSKVRLKEH